jgi:CubicO group peptidase (beta-lactamase class C family)
MVAWLLPLTLLVLILAGGARADATAPIVAAPDADAADRDSASPVPTAAPPRRREDLVGYLSPYGLIRTTRPVPRGDGSVVPLRRAAQPFDVVYPWEGSWRRLADYLERHPVTGLLIARGDTVLFEHYREGLTGEARFLTYSVAKTLTGLLVGVALREGAIRSLDDSAADYVPELAGTEYGGTPIRALLRMSSGIAYREAGDVERLNRGLEQDAVAALRPFGTRAAPPGERFAYSSADSEVLGLVVARATGVPLAEYLSTRIWRRLGAEADAVWGADGAGEELGFCCVAARLRDWARLGLMLAHDGAWNSGQVVPREWLLEMTARRDGDRGVGFGYGYQLWLLPGARRMFALLGLHGQAILVDPRSRLVMVHTAVRPLPRDDPTALETWALWFALAAQHGATP